MESTGEDIDHDQIDATGESRVAAGRAATEGTAPRSRAGTADSSSGERRELLCDVAKGRVDEAQYAQMGQPVYRQANRWPQRQT